MGVGDIECVWAKGVEGELVGETVINLEDWMSWRVAQCMSCGKGN